MKKQFHQYIIFFILPYFLLGCNSKIDPSSLEEGEILWQFNDLGETLEAGPAIDSQGNIYLLTEKELYSFSKEGDLRWSTEISGGDGSTASISPDGKVVYAPGIEGVFAVNTTNGEILWGQTNFEGEEFHTVAATSMENRKIYLGSGADRNDSNNFYSLNMDDGSIAWVYEETEACNLCGYIGGAIIDEDGVIYVTNQHGFVISITDHGADYTVNWKFDLGGEARQPAAIAGDGFIVQTSNRGIVHKIDPSTGEEVTTENWPALGDVGEVFTPIVFSPDGGTFYVNAEDAQLHALDYESGAVKWSFKFEAWGSDPLIREDGIILVMCQHDGAGRVCAIEDNGTNGELLWTSEKIVRELPLNETNLNITPDGTIMVHSGDQPPWGLFAIQGNGLGLSLDSPWAKYMGNIENNGNPPKD